MSINLKELSSEFNNLKLDYDLKKKNWFNIGGKTKIYFKGDNLKDLIKFLKKIENKEKILAGIGRFGPYLKHGASFTSIPPDDDVLNIGLNRAVDLIASNPRKKTAAKPVSPKILTKSRNIQIISNKIPFMMTKNSEDGKHAMIFVFTDC